MRRMRSRRSDGGRDPPNEDGPPGGTGLPGGTGHRVAPNRPDATGTGRRRNMREGDQRSAFARATARDVSITLVGLRGLSRPILLRNCDDLIPVLAAVLGSWR